MKTLKSTTFLKGWYTGTVLPDFKFFVGFAETIRWQMLTMMLEKGISRATFLARSGWSGRRLQGIILNPDKPITIREMAEWFFTIDGGMMKFSMTPKEQITTRRYTITN